MEARKRDWHQGQEGKTKTDKVAGMKERKNMNGGHKKGCKQSMF